VKTVKPITIAAACVFGGCCLAQEPNKPMGAITSTKPVAIDGTSMSPTGSASWPVMERDEIATQAPAMLTTGDHNVIVLDADTKIRLDAVSPVSGEAKQTYIFLRQGGLSFDAKTSRIYICAAARLFVPEVLSKGVVRLDATGAVSQSLASGVFAEQGKRSCTESGPGNFLTGVPGAAGGAVGPAAGGASTAATVRAIALGVGVAVAAAASSFFSTSFNPNPAPISAINPSSPDI
jgi:hypothetical protein